ncbi:hypothetical protein B0T13DRAFT_194212 [Neurospora crassa]|nr:hypothetical protein B0T13DRAFT_194212 [Neurospora crassa]
MQRVGHVVLRFPSIRFPLFPRRVNVRNCFLVVALLHVGLPYGLSPTWSKECPKLKLTGSCIADHVKKPCAIEHHAFHRFDDPEPPQSKTWLPLSHFPALFAILQFPRPGESRKLCHRQLSVTTGFIPSEDQEEGLVQYPLPKKTSVFQKHPRLV